MSGLANAMTSKTSAQGGVKAFSTVLGYTSNIVNQQFNVDNMQQAPDSLSNANGNPYFALSISGIKPRLDYYTIPDGVLKQTISKFADEGVPINKYMSIQDIINKHSAYDFIRIRIEKTNNLINELSGYEYERLKSILQDGRRFWYSDDSTFILPVLNYFK